MTSVAQSSFDSLFNEGAKAFAENDYKSAIESFNLASKLDSTKTDVYTYLGYSWFQNNEYDSSIYYLSKSIELDSTNAEVYYARGISLITTSIFTSHNSCNDLRKAKQLGYQDDFLESQLRSKCWKHDDVFIRSEGLNDSTIIDKLYSIIPNNWSFLEFTDQSSLKNSENEIEQLLKYYFVLINRDASFIDSRYSEEATPEITILIGDKSLKRTFSKQLKNNKKNMKKGEILNTDMLENDKALIVIRWNSEFRISNFAPENIKEQYFNDKKQLINSLMAYEW